jgi:hypothetical protein
MAKKKAKKIGGSSASIKVLEKAILEDEDRLHEGADFCIKHRNGEPWPAWEKVALELASSDSYFIASCIAYARDVKKGRWPELEPILREWMWEFDEDCHAVDYVRQVTRTKWDELERYRRIHGL